MPNCRPRPSALLRVRLHNATQRAPFTSPHAASWYRDQKPVPMIPNLRSFTVPLLAFARDALDVVNLLDAIGVAVGAENVVKPDGRFVGVSLGPGFPGINRL